MTDTSVMSPDPQPQELTANQKALQYVNFLLLTAGELKRGPFLPQQEQAFLARSFDSLFPDEDFQGRVGGEVALSALRLYTENLPALIREGDLQYYASTELDTLARVQEVNQLAETLSQKGVIYTGTEYPLLQEAGITRYSDEVETRFKRIGRILLDALAIYFTKNKYREDSRFDNFAVMFLKGIFQPIEEVEPLIEELQAFGVNLSELSLENITFVPYADPNYASMQEMLRLDQTEIHLAKLEKQLKPEGNE